MYWMGIADARIGAAAKPGVRIGLGNDRLPHRVTSSRSS
jgi:hypothetical protein